MVSHIFLTEICFKSEFTPKFILWETAQTKKQHRSDLVRLSSNIKTTAKKELNFECKNYSKSI